MCRSRVIAASLLWILLLSSTAGWIGHEHDAGGAADYACAETHLSEQLGTAPADGAWHTAGPLHEHHCLGCRFNGKRSLAQPWQGIKAALHVCLGKVPFADASPRTAVLRSGGTLRGPPLA